MSAKARAHFVFGNHGEAPSQVEDFYQVLRDLTRYSLGIELGTSRYPVAGAVNFVLEGFEPYFVEFILRTKTTHPQTTFVCLATEFVTGDTFNDFDAAKAVRGAEPSRPWAHAISPAMDAAKKVLPLAVKRRLSDSAPRFYSAAKRALDVISPPAPSRARDTTYWRARFECFLRALGAMEEVWIVSEDQRSGYGSLIEGQKLWLLPTIPYVEPRRLNAIHSPSSNECDIDFLFTGAASDYRARFFEKLRREGFNVVTGPIELPPFIRNDYLARAKICLHVRPHENWAFASVMRLNHLLLSGKYTVSEATRTKCLQYDFVQLAEPDELLNACLQAVRRDDLRETGLARREAYIHATSNRREQIKTELTDRLAPRLG